MMEMAEIPSPMQSPPAVPSGLDPSSSQGSLECDHYDLEQVRLVSRSLLHTLATACVEKTYGDLFKTPISVAGDIRNELIEFLKQHHLHALPPSSPGSANASPADMSEDLLDQFVHSKTSFLSRVSSKIMSNETKEDKIDDLVDELEEAETWIASHREQVAKMLLKNFDINRSSSCGMKFEKEEDLAQHKKMCRLRPVVCGNEGCGHVFSALHVVEHDKSCPFKLLRCEQHCETMIIRSEMDKHCVTDCPMRPVKCPFFNVGCSNMIPMRHLDQHIHDSTGSHLLNVLDVVQKQETVVSGLTQRILLLEKALAISQRSEAADVGNLTLTIRQQEAKIKSLEQETNRLRHDLKGLNVSAEISQLRQQLQILQKKVGI